MTNHGDHLQRISTGLRVQFEWMTFRRALGREVVDRFAETVGADPKQINSSKALLDRKHPAVLRLNALRRTIRDWWFQNSLPYVEQGIRLVRQEKVTAFNEQLQAFERELADAVAELSAAYAEIVDDARERLGSLFDGSDYPADPASEFQMSWDFPSLAPPDYLLQINPALYEQELAKMKARFSETVELAETTFATEFATLVGELRDRITAENMRFPEGKLRHIQEFVGRFRDLSIGSNGDLDRLVDQFDDLAGGITRDALDADAVKQQLTNTLSEMGEAVNDVLERRPARTIRIPKAEPAAAE